MQTANEIKSIAGNIEYYCQRTRELLNKQFDLDMEELGETSIETREARIDRLSELAEICSKIVAHCAHIKIALENIVSLERKVQ